MALRDFLNRRLSIREAALVVLAVSILGGVGYLGYVLLKEAVLEARIAGALPQVRASIRAERDHVARAIEAYKLHFGGYPPDHVLSRQPMLVDPITNTLLYELAGVVYNPTNKMFVVRGLEPAEASYVKAFLHCETFRNCSSNESQLIRFLTNNPLPAPQLHDDPDVFALGFYLPYEVTGPHLVWQFDLSPWRYVSSSPTNNPGKFDLWLDVRTRRHTFTVGNWKAVE